MLQELTSQAAANWATLSLLFFIAVYVFVSIRLFRERREVLDAQARLALDDGDAVSAGAPEARQS
ncbi:MAG TPA: hypothetical protein VF491_01025 [Vicinamibacterales bacterium]|jgi:cbb3-type cytochrome oxidase subunit 3